MNIYLLSRSSLLIKIETDFNLIQAKPFSRKLITYMSIWLNFDIIWKEPRRSGKLPDFF